MTFGPMNIPGEKRLTFGPTNVPDEIRQVDTSSVEETEVTISDASHQKVLKPMDLLKMKYDEVL